MKDKMLAQAIHQLFKEIHKGGNKILKDFDPETIHEYRVNIKKLRGMLGLVAYHYNHIVKPSLTKKIKTFYGYVGIVRNLQIQQQVIVDYCTLHAAALPETYLAGIMRDEIYWKKQAMDFMSNGNNFWDDEETIINNLPPHLNEKAVKNFLADKIAELKTLVLYPQKDSNLHMVRKLLKNILYTWSFIPHHTVTESLTKDEITTLTDALGLFRDKCTAITHVQDAALQQVKDEKEKVLLYKIQEELKNDKQRVKEQAIELLEIVKQKLDEPVLSFHRTLSV